MLINFAHLCDYASVSAEGKLSVMGIFDVINAPALPWTHPTFYIAFQLESTREEVNQSFAVRVECVDQDGARVFKVEANYSPTATLAIGETQRHSQMLVLHNLKFSKPGRYEVNMFVRNELLRRIPLDIKQIVPLR